MNQSTDREPRIPPCPLIERFAADTFWLVRCACLAALIGIALIAGRMWP